MTGVKSIFSCSVTACVVSAIALALTQQPWGIAALAPLALVPMLIRATALSAARAGLLGVSTGVTYFFVSHTWVAPALYELGAPVWGIVAGSLSAGLWAQGFAMGLLALGINLAKRMGNPAGLVSAMVLGAFVDAGAASGMAGQPFLLLGHAMADVPGIAQLAMVGGTAVLSGLIVLANQLVALTLESRTRWEAIGGLAGMLLSAIALTLFAIPVCEYIRDGRPPGDGGVSIAAIQPNISGGERWNKDLQRTSLETLGVLSRIAMARAQPPSLLLWPEMTFPLPLEEDPALGNEIQAWVDRLRVPVILGVGRQASNRSSTLYRNSAVRVEPGVGITAALSKVRAIPVIESVSAPLGLGPLRSILGDSADGPWVEETADEGPMVGSPGLAVLLCYEALFPPLAARRRDETTAAIAVLADDDWIRSHAFREQILAVTAFRAIEQRLTLIRISQRGPSVVFDPYGRTVSRLEQDRPGFLLVDVARTPPPNFTERAALMSLLASGFVVVGFSRLLFRRRSSTCYAESRPRCSQPF